MSRSQSSHLVSQSCQVSLEAFVFALQSLDAGQVVAVVVGVQRLVLLLDPLFGLVGVPEEAQRTPLKHLDVTVTCNC